MIPITYGSTRLVLLFGDKAIKVGRIRPLCLLAHVLFLLFSERRRNKYFKKYGSTFLQAAYNDLFAGLVANQGEYKYYQESRDWRVMPTIHKWIGGWIIIQLRGVPVSAVELAIKRPPIPVSIGQEDCETTKSIQFCRYQNGVVLVDYGMQTTREALCQTT